MNNPYQKYVDENFHFLDETSIINLAQNDNGSINNVISGLHKECYGLYPEEENSVEKYCLFYINGTNRLAGLVFKLSISHPDRNELTFVFSKIVNDKFETDTDLISIFNTFQDQTRTFYEKRKVYTFGEEMVDKTWALKTNDLEGIAFVPSIKRTEAFKSIFKDSIHKNKDALVEENKIYLMFNSRNGFTKIGRSKNPSLRERTLQGQEPEITILAWWQGPISLEKDLHQKFDSKRIRGEWFDLSIKNLMAIRDIFMLK